MTSAISKSEHDARRWCLESREMLAVGSSTGVLTPHALSLERPSLEAEWFEHTLTPHGTWSFQLFLYRLDPLIAGCLTPNFYLDASHNVIETEKDEADEVEDDRIREMGSAAEAAARARVASKREIMA